MDPIAGSIVWVQRRNGSWWPGKVLSPNELPLCNLSSPPPGTPVKLLGREDATVEWYNLEKSKRIKAFRCGEFDDCIQKAESSQGVWIKKKDRYARREDAILHALHLENQLLVNEGRLGGANNTSRPLKTMHVNPNSIQLNHERTQSISQPRFLQNAKDGYLAGCRDDDNSAVTPRMRGLQDLGVKTVSLKRKPSSSDASDDSHKLVLYNNSHALFNGAADVVCRQIDEGNQAKRCRAGSSDNTSDGKQVETLSSQTEDGNDSDLKENDSESLEETETDFSSSESSESDSDYSSKTELDDTDEEEMTDISGPTFSGTGVHAHGRYAALQPRNVSIDESDESAFSGDLPYLDGRLLAHETVSKWKLKGKRNTRNLSNRSAFRAHRNHDYNHSYNVTGLNERDRMVGLNINRQYMYNSSIGRNFPYPDNFTEWDDVGWDSHQHDLRGRWDPRFVRHEHFGVRTKPVLIDVEVQVQPDHNHKPRDPIISLTSKFDGKAIIGRSIPIRVLDEGSFENIFPAHDYFDNDVIYHDIDLTCPPAWRTARRTNFRVPRVRPSLEVDDDYSPFMDRERKSNLVGKPHSSRLPMDKGFSRKSWKKGNSLSNQKTRTLASISMEHNRCAKPMNVIKNSQIDGFIKPGLSGPTTVACIPVKLVFSRLLEKISRPPSKPASKVVVASENLL
ncbi:hypothetical protein ACFE04_004302 [Oxalis oulophora]